MHLHGSAEKNRTSATVSRVEKVANISHGSVATHLTHFTQSYKMGKVTKGLDARVEIKTKNTRLASLV